MEQLLPAWKNETEYASMTTPDFEGDLQKVETAIQKIEGLNAEWAAELADFKEEAKPRPGFIEALREISTILEDADVRNANLFVYLNCELSLDAQNAPAQKLLSRVQRLVARLSTVTKARDLYLGRCSSECLRDYLASPQTEAQAFYWREERKKRDLLLSQDEEKTIAQFRQYGLNSWSDLYNQITGSLRVQVDTRGEMGLAQAAGLLRSQDETLRRSAWEGIQAAFKAYEAPCAAILNNLAGFRLEEAAKRSHTREIDFLEFPLMISKIERATLDAMLAAVEERQDLNQRALRLIAKCLGKPALDPWDLLASSPRTSKNAGIAFDRAIEMVTSAFAGVSAEMGEFVRMMLKQGWIDARILPNKRSGAYCTGFAKSRTPRVFQTYVGSYNDVSTLAHELGHAWHGWVMRDLPLVQARYPMTLAETASIFAETALADQLFANGDAETRFDVAWAEVVHGLGLLTNIPARFEFEKNFYQARKNGTLAPAELNALMEQAFRKWYGDGLTRPESQFWMTKLHFSMSHVSFYNFPYTFGYLFSLGIYARREKQGADFAHLYTEILRDTGRMTAEEIVQAYLGQDIRQKDFWLASLQVFEEKVARLERLLVN